MSDATVRLREAESVLHRLEIQVEQYRIHLEELTAQFHEAEKARAILRDMISKLRWQRTYCALLSNAVERPDQKKDGPNVDIEVFSFLTTLPNALTETTNHERSPVIFTEEDQFSSWLTGTPEEAFRLKPSDPGRMEIVQSGFAKKDLLAAA